MNRKITILIMLVAFNNLIQAQSAKEIAKICLPSTVSLIMVDNYKQPLSLGSGFIIDDGKIVTNLHVIEGAKYGFVLLNGDKTKHKIEGYYSIDNKNDLAILSVPTLIGTPLILSDNLDPEIGEKIYAIGNPKGLSGTISTGIISGIRNMSNQNLIQITAPISPGSSGGPVINNSGKVIGVAVGTLTSGQNLNFAIPASLVKDLLSKDVTSITSLNISKGKISPKVNINEKNIKDGIEIRDWKYDDGYTVGYPGVTVVRSVSFKNNLPFEIKNMKLLFILYDKHNIPIDYYETIFFEYEFNGGILKPFLGKTVEFDSSQRVFRKEHGENLEIRILDFKIIE